MCAFLSLPHRRCCQDVMVQVFHEMGIGDPRVLHDFYQTRVVNYHHNMLQSCENLKREYERVKNPETRTSGITKSLIRFVVVKQQTTLRKATSSIM